MRFARNVYDVVALTKRHDASETSVDSAIFDGADDDNDKRSSAFCDL